MIDFLLGVPGKLKTVLDRLTSTRAANLDNLDAAISTRAPASTALSTAQWTNTRAGLLDGIIQTSIIASIQTGYVSAAGTAGTGEDAKYVDITITAVASVSKCVVLINGSLPAGYQATSCTARLTSTTNVRVSVPDGTASPRGRWTVIEFK